MCAVLWLLSRPCQAQYPDALNGAKLTTVRSPQDAAISIAYTRPLGACTTALDSQEQLAGWVTVAADADRPYASHTFFWFVGAREPTAALTMYLNGGPGSSSLFGLFAETGPCAIVETSAAGLGTVARAWGWDRASNMLFVDQPAQVGLSFDALVNGTLDRYSNNITVGTTTDSSDPMLLRGTFASQDPGRTANTTALAAHAVYHLLQAFLAEFPRYSPPKGSSLGVNLFAESYGGHYGPVFAAQWQAENAKSGGHGGNSENSTNTTSTSTNTTLHIHLAALGLINGCVDDLIQGPHYAAMLVNNSYGFHVVPPLQAALVNASFYASGGCGDQIAACRAAVARSDPDDDGSSAAANSACALAQNTCAAQMIDPYGAAGRSVYDLAHALPDSFPPAYYVDYLNSDAVQKALGAPLNFTAASSAVSAAFAATGDLERASDTITDLAALLQAGVRVGLIYGDRDYICNWLGGEAVSLAVARAAAGSYADRFPRAGYAPIIVNDSYIGGAVRQFANLSFSRIYQAGHFVPASQPETAFEVFARIIYGTDIGTGEPVDLAVFNSSGPLHAASSLSLPSSPAPTCFLGNAPDSCADDQLASLHSQSGVVINGIWYAAKSDWPGPASGLVAAADASSHRNPSSSPGHTTMLRGSATADAARASLTGIYTATATPAAAEPFCALTPAPWSVTALALAVGLFSCLGAELLTLRLV
ncbi:carboxypeptidase s1 [Grosmannia clavigera kw1407]|uniref:Carboxypeptidase n=1 Tax=Grosmannia clavigera (strain kw1407 / UAMH 11150) TaxID=655863 RepID=F0XMD1_GROCL|nr:carboxypeptidase s1 [Grosmannia clavigera kw1407]EFX01471.1 carboxypeptidase s1 [Grosmannia clavigera kw1407]